MALDFCQLYFRLANSADDPAPTACEDGRVFSEDRLIAVRGREGVRTHRSSVMLGISGAEARGGNANRTQAR